MQFFKKSIWSGLAVLSRGIGALAINKIFAFYFGTSGITLLAHFQNLISIFTFIPNDGINRGVIRSCSSPEEPDAYKQEVISTAILFTSLIFTLLIIVVFIRNDYFIEPFISLISKGVFLVILFFSVLAILANLLVQSLILSQKKIKAYSILALLTTLILLVFVWLGVSYRILEIAFIAYAIGSALSLVFSLFYLNRGMHFRITLSEPSSRAVSELVQFMAMSFSVLIFGKVVDFFIRSNAISWFGMEETGYWQSLVKVSDSYTMVYVGTVGAVFFPAVSALVGKRKELFNYLQQVLFVVVPSLIVIFIILYLLGKPILGILFTEEFETAYQWMHYQVIGDFFMLVSFLLAYILMAYRKMVFYISLQAVSAVVYLCCIYFLKSNMGIESILIGHVASNFIFFFILTLLIRKL